ncbi:MAG: DUF262 domain-containing protein [Eggerthellaceae bacterium]|nr:DUF262 domain-containing protein [Eggerthellaceae bacterium]
MLPSPSSKLHDQLIAQIEEGRIKIPQFQRKFVWSVEESAALLDSIIKGYPIGTFIFWDTQERLRSVRNIGDIELPETPDGRYVQYVLDGQQRITSLYVSYKGAKVLGDDGKLVDYGEVYVDLTASEEDQVIIVDVSGRDADSVVRFDRLMNDPFAVAQEHPDHASKLDEYRKAFLAYPYSVIIMEDASIDVATEVFTRINVGGKALSNFEIMAARVYDDGKGFDLAEKCDELLERLEQVDYETISRTTILQTISVCMTKSCTKKQILRLDKNQFISVWDDAASAIESAVEYFKQAYKIPVSRLLPYNALIVPFAYYFYNHPETPLGEHQVWLQDYFWRVVINSRFSSALESKIGQDILRFDSMLSGQKPANDELVDICVQALDERGSVRTSYAFIKGMLCILAARQPRSLKDGALVNISNNWLKQANSKNYHHFFPKAFLKKQGIDAWRANHIGNITIVDDFLNKRMIRDKAPSAYTEEFARMNPNLTADLETHLIGDLEEFGILGDDYEEFLKQRLQRFQEELIARLVLTEGDRVERG